MAWDDMSCHAMAWDDMAWDGMAWKGMAWHGIIDNIHRFHTWVGMHILDIESGCSVTRSVSK